MEILQDHKWIDKYVSTYMTWAGLAKIFFLNSFSTAIIHLSHSASPSSFHAYTYLFIVSTYSYMIRWFGP